MPSRDTEGESGRGEPELRLVPAVQGPEVPPRAYPEPTGPPEVAIRTFLIADVRGYTSFTASRGDEAAGALAARFAEVTRGVVAEHSGQLVELRGDEALVVFTSARSAIRAALALQDRFVTETLADMDLPLPVGIGLDVGEAVQVEGGYRGGALNLAARLCGAAAPGEVLASREVTHLARHIQGARYVERGAVAFKGLAEPVAVVRVVPDTVDAKRDAAFRAAVTPQQGRRRPRRQVLVAAAVVAVLLVGVGAYGVLRTIQPPPVLSDQNRVEVVDPSSGHVVDQVLLDQQPSAVAAGAGSVWVTNGASGTVSRLDQKSRQLRDTIDVGGQPSGVVFAGGSVWVTDQDGRTVARISPDVDRVVDTVTVGNAPTAIDAGKSGIWVANSTDGTVTRINARTGKVSGRVDVGAGPAGLVVTDDAVWVTNNAEGTVSAIDPVTVKKRISYAVGNGPTGITALGRALWIANNLDGTLTRLDLDTRTVTALQVGDGPTAVAAAGGAVWVSNEYGATLVRVNTATNRVDRTLLVGGTPHGLTAVGGRLWVTAAATTTAHRGGTLTVSEDGVGGSNASIDPGINYGIAVDRVSYDGLVGLRHAAGAAGTTLVPDLATELPRPDDDGKTYAFQLRKGIRYSTGVPVRASDLRRAIERQFRLPISGARDDYDGILGAGACLTHREAAEALDDPTVRDAADSGDVSAEQKLRPSVCDMSAGIETDDSTGSVTFHLERPDAEFLYKLTLSMAAAVPPGTPDYDIGTKPIPATGPYKISRYVPGGSAELVRNPYFREWSRAAQPDGYPDRIVFQPEGQDDLDDVLAGRADLARVAGSSPRLQELKTRYAAQLHHNTGAFLNDLAFNITNAPFKNILARQALSYAVDAQQLLKAAGGDDVVQRTCQVLPPDLPGYAPYCLYHTDLAEALRLVARSGTAGDRVTVLLPVGQEAIGTYLKEILTSLRYKVRIDLRDPDSYFGVASSPHPQAQLALSGWTADYPAPSGFLEPLISCREADPAKASNNLGRFCDRRVESKMNKALALQQTSPAVAGRLWQQVDREVVDLAALLPISIPLDLTLTSRRVGNYLQQPLYGVLVDQLWVK